MKNKLYLLISLIITLYIPNVYAATCPLGKDVTQDLSNILKIIQILGPIIVIVVTVFEVTKSISKGDVDKESKKLGIRLGKRAIYCILLFFIPVLIQTGASIAQIDVSSCDLSNPSDNNYTVETTSKKTIVTEKTTQTRRTWKGRSSGESTSTGSGNWTAHPQITFTGSNGASTTAGGTCVIATGATIIEGLTGTSISTEAACQEVDSKGHYPQSFGGYTGGYDGSAFTTLVTAHGVSVSYFYPTVDQVTTILNNGGAIAANMSSTAMFGISGSHYITLYAISGDTVSYIDNSGLTSGYFGTMSVSDLVNKTSGQVWNACYKS